MPDDTMRRRRRIAADAFRARRGELDLTQEQVAAAAGVHTRTVQNLESHRWPNPATLARLEKAVGWPPGEMRRLAAPPVPFMDPQLLDRVSELDEGEREWLISWLIAARERPPGGERRRGG